MRDHHLKAIARLTAEIQKDPRFQALIIGGSVAKGRETETSDVDCILVATEEEYAQRLENKDFWYFSRELTDYPDGYVEGKVVNLAFLQAVAERGSEPARAAFQSAFVAWSEIPNLQDLLATIAVYPEQERRAKIESFYSQVMIQHWYVGEAAKRQDNYLLKQASTDLAFYGGRLILAHNKILYPYHKWFTWELEHAPVKPTNFMPFFQQLLENPSRETALAYRDCLVNFQDWGVSYAEAIVRFAEDSEWNWLEHKPPLRDS